MSVFVCIGVSMLNIFGRKQNTWKVFLAQLPKKIGSALAIIFLAQLVMAVGSGRSSSRVYRPSLRSP